MSSTVCCILPSHECISGIVNGKLLFVSTVSGVLAPGGGGGGGSGGGTRVALEVGPSPSADQQSLELTVFLKKRSIIHKGILNNVQDIASRLFARHLIPDRVYGIVTGALDRLTAYERTDLLLSELESRISVQAAALTQFLDVLNESDACYIPLVRTISEFRTIRLVQVYIQGLVGH